MKRMDYEKIISHIHNVRYGGLPTHYPSLVSWEENIDPQKANYTWKKFFNSDSREPFSIYINIPFCKSKCKFCFIDVLSSKEVPEEYCSLLEKEMEIYKNLGAKRKKVDSVYIGGGTPNLLTSMQLKRLLKSLNSNFDLSSGRQVIMEANPGMFDRDKIEIAASFGVNAITMGIQSFDEDVSAENNRTQNIDDFFFILDLLKHKNIRINLDLLIGLTKNPQIFRKDIKFLLKAKPDQIHLYRLRPLNESFTGEQKDLLIKLQNKFFQFLLKDGYRRIDEDSCSFSGESINIQGSPDYHVYSTILGLGINAMGHVFNKMRYRNANSISQYRKKISSGFIPVHSGIFITEEQEIRHYCIIGLSNGKVSMMDMSKKFSNKAIRKILIELEKMHKKDIIAKAKTGYCIKGDTDFFNIFLSLYEKKYLTKIANKYGYWK